MTRLVWLLMLFRIVSLADQTRLGGETVCKVKPGSLRKHSDCQVGGNPALRHTRVT